MREAKKKVLGSGGGLRRPPSHVGSVEHGISDSGNSRGISIIHDFIGISGLVHSYPLELSTYALPYDRALGPAGA